ncbi:MAG: hypothetical protein JWL70_1829, partial [Acidimicrobiia bacterium]|nr:hypothetical protein [Acidimicrobiia bacterium]
RWPVAVLSAAAAIIVLVVGAVILTRGTTKVDYRSELAASALAPGAKATVKITREDGGFRIYLDAEGLPPLPPGQFYEAWLKNSAATLVPVGTFSSSESDITLWSGVSPSDFPTLTVTIEATDNQQASSGRVVLAGPVRPAG